MPALSLSLIDAVPGPVSRPDPALASCLAAVPDPRRPRGVRHSLTPLSMASVAAVLAGARSFTVIGEWIADAPPQVMAALGIRRDPLTGRFGPPDQATIRRVLEAVDAEALDAPADRSRCDSGGPGNAPPAWLRTARRNSRFTNSWRSAAPPACSCRSCPTLSALSRELSQAQRDRPRLPVAAATGKAR